jgi:beta-lactamase superfamily II metal-dependent hydrolase
MFHLSKLNRFIISILGALFIFLGLLSPLQAGKELTVHFIDVGDGESTLISLPSGENILVDTGSPIGGPKVVRYLSSLGINRVDHLVITHPHPDHMGGTFSILEWFDVSSIYDNGLSNFRSDFFEFYIQAVRADLSRYRILQAGESLLFNDVRIDVLNPILPPTGNPNNDSIVLRLIYKDIRILFTGDLGYLGERRLLKLGIDIESQILKLGHHGENDASSNEFLTSVRPEVAIISVSKSDKYARPHPEVLKRLKQAGVRVFRTDYKGSIVLRTNGTTYSISTER